MSNELSADETKGGAMFCLTLGEKYYLSRPITLESRIIIPSRTKVVFLEKTRSGDSEGRFHRDYFAYEVVSGDFSGITFRLAGNGEERASLLPQRNLKLAKNLAKLHGVGKEDRLILFHLVFIFADPSEEARVEFDRVYDALPYTHPIIRAFDEYSDRVEVL